MTTSKQKSDEAELYYQMLRIRMVEERIAEEYPKQEMRCPVHLSIGQEGVAVGVCAVLPSSALMYSGHRSHAHYLAKGGDLKRMIAEIHGKVTGCTRGNGGSMHLIDRSVGFEGATSIVAGTVPVAVGAAWAMKLKGDPRIVVSWLGDSALEEGIVHESLNFAALHQLRILFVIENNGYSCYTPRIKRQPHSLLFNINKSYDIYGDQTDGSQVARVRNSAEYLMSRMAERAQPTILIANCERFMEHCGPNNDDHLNYREKPDPEWDPLHADNNAVDWSFDDVKIEAKIKAEIDEAFDFARKSSFPLSAELGAYVYAK